MRRLPQELLKARGYVIQKALGAPKLRDSKDEKKDAKKDAKEEKKKEAVEEVTLKLPKPKDDARAKWHLGALDIYL